LDIPDISEAGDNSVLLYRRKAGGREWTILSLYCMLDISEGGEEGRREGIDQRLMKIQYFRRKAGGRDWTIHPLIILYLDISEGGEERGNRPTLIIFLIFQKEGRREWTNL
jgi:hypothetical protein